MPSHYSSLGFRFRSEQEFEQFTVDAAGEATAIETSRGTYYRWTSTSGAELWLQVDENNSLIGAHPHYAGESSLAIRAVAHVLRPDEDTPLDGAFHAWVNPEDDFDGEYPLVFDAANFHEFSDVALPAEGSVQLVAFAHSLTWYESAEHYARSQEREIKFASHSFIPIGLFHESGGPESHALFTGHVVRAERKRNEESGGEFLWAAIETLGGIYDVVIDPALLETVPRAGSVLSGTFWLSGRVDALTR